MIPILLDVFKEYYEKGGANEEERMKSLTDKYQLKKGFYFKINKDGSIDNLMITGDHSENDLYKWFRARYMISLLLSKNNFSNDSRKMKSMNFMTFFINNTHLLKYGKNSGKTNNQDSSYYEKVKLKDEKDLSEMEKLILSYYEEVRKYTNRQEVNKCEEYLITNVNEIINQVGSYEDSKFFKKKNKGGNGESFEKMDVNIFFDYSLSEYLDEAIEFINKKAYKPFDQLENKYFPSLCVSSNLKKSSWSHLKKS